MVLVRQVLTIRSALHFFGCMQQTANTDLRKKRHKRLKAIQIQAGLELQYVLEKDGFLIKLVA